jgi:hypothetical protein
LGEYHLCFITSRSVVEDHDGLFATKVCGHPYSSEIRR